MQTDERSGAWAVAQETTARMRHSDGRTSGRTDMQTDERAIERPQVLYGQANEWANAFGREDERTENERSDARTESSGKLLAIFFRNSFRKLFWVI